MAEGWHVSLSCTHHLYFSSLLLVNERVEDVGASWSITTSLAVCSNTPVLGSPLKYKIQSHPVGDQAIFLHIMITYSSLSMSAFFFILLAQCHLPPKLFLLFHVHSNCLTQSEPILFVRSFWCRVLVFTQTSPLFSFCSLNDCFSTLKRKGSAA